MKYPTRSASVVLLVAVLAFSVTSELSVSSSALQARPRGRALGIPFFRATIDATEEAVVKAMLAAETMTGVNGMRVFGLPGDRVVAVLKKYGRMK